MFLILRLTLFLTAKNGFQHKNDSSYSKCKKRFRNSRLDEEGELQNKKLLVNCSLDIFSF